MNKEQSRKWNFSKIFFQTQFIYVSLNFISLSILLRKSNKSPLTDISNDRHGRPHTDNERNKTKTSSNIKYSMKLVSVHVKYDVRL